MLFDTDVLIWVLRGNKSAAKQVDESKERYVSIVTYMELLQGARDRHEIKLVKRFLSETGFEVLPLTDEIGHRALIYIEEYTLSSGMGVADALVGATAVENQLSLCTGNEKHYRPIHDLELKVFRLL